jgi:Cu+-exporting ATPase
MSKTKKIDLPVTGMTCASCVAVVEKGLKKLNGVSKVGVNLATEKATVTYDPAKTKLEAFIAETKKLGYDVAVEKATIPIQGMTCASCVAAIEKALKKLDGVLKVNVNLATEKATLEFLPTIISLHEIKKAIKDAGYEPLEIEEAIEDREKEARIKEAQELRKR